MQITRAGATPAAKGPADWFNSFAPDRVQGGVNDGRVIDWLEPVTDADFGV